MVNKYVCLYSLCSKFIQPIKSPAKLLQIFEIHKDLAEKVKFIYSFCGKNLLFAQKRRQRGAFDSYQ